MASLLQPAERTRYDEQFAAIRAMPPPIPASERYRATIEEVGIGGYLRFEGKTYLVKGMNAYEREGARWPELILYCLNDGAIRYLEWEKEDEIAIYVSRETLSFAEVGLRDKEHLWEISEAEAGAVSYDGARFRYHEDSAVTFYRDSGETGTPFHQYLFKNDERRAYVGVEEWGGDEEGYEHNVILSAYLDPRSVDVMVRKGAGD